MITRVNFVNDDKKTNQMTLCVCKHYEKKTSESTNMHVFKFSDTGVSSGDKEPFLRYFFSMVESLLPPYRIIFDLSEVHQVSEIELEDLIAIGLVFFDLGGRVVVSGASESIQAHLLNQGVSRFMPQVEDLQSAVSLFE